MLNFYPSIVKKSINSIRAWFFLAGFSQIGYMIQNLSGDWKGLKVFGNANPREIFRTGGQNNND